MHGIIFIPVRLKGHFSIFMDYQEEISIQDRSPAEVPSFAVLKKEVEHIK